MIDYIKIIVIALVVILIAKFVFHLNGKKLMGLIINAVVGFLILWLINLTGLITIPINIVTSLIAGVLGIPGVIILIVLKLMGLI